MDLVGFLEAHRRSGADLTIAVSPVNPEEAKALGIMRLDHRGRLVEFVEKPQDAEVIEHFTLDDATVAATGVDAEAGSLLASMGIYIFKTEVLVDLLATEGDDFGKNLIPRAVADSDVYGFVHRGYWRDIGTIGAFHAASLELTHQLPSLNLYDADRPVFTRPRFLPAGQGDRLPCLRVAARRWGHPLWFGDPEIGHRYPVPRAVRFGDRSHRLDGQPIV